MTEYEALQRFEQLVNTVNPLGRRMYFQQALVALKQWVDNQHAKEAPRVSPKRR